MSRWLVRLLGLTLGLLLPLVASGAGFTELERMVERGFLVSAEARLLDTGEVLGAIEPQRQLSPASVTKAYLAAAALDRWGPQHRFTTRLVSDAELNGTGVVAGDLILDGGGDPALTTEDLWRLAQRLHQRGVREVEGRLVVSQWRFGPVECITTDRCQAHTRTANAYSALLSSAGVNYGSWCVSVAPGAAAGQPAQITSCDSQTTIVGIDNHVETHPPNSGTEFSAERVTGEEGDVMVLRGQISLNASPREVYRASSDPAQQTARTMTAMLEQAGIAVRQGYATSVGEPPAAARTLAAVDGKPLQELLLRTMNYSNNFMADVLALNLVDTPRSSLLQAGDAIEHYTTGMPDHGPLIMQSGSGLTTENRTSAHGSNILLESMFHRTALFPSFVASFQSPANGVSRFIRRGSSTFQNHVMLKTGTLNQPIAVRSVNGYFRTLSGRWGAFTVLVNGTATTPWLNWAQVLDPLADDLERMIEAH
ncbi:D-alanyl-D-alanine carboxypeptidase/D-alanyl-D-alanine endopeptidase [Billgrantia montanilacus]|uniref:D-alanyl-D-alanine carboxypeptidase/D-alanyl-D-alanine-endopeptidase n=1 Tax=Billgrantia montanilacus TaxID=2282305 RepID=A0A368TW35_9GAMM|nr:D-alanyl-D-alanine carboxypeptidase/D-alanyl-D-alanine-endopeptidase [Halomonas montanilacus]RCV88162.1 D-alanyl-D-alanine carboxypeptidase/D-alanyl-D-alanine-endopeptidase [Halomonas montanilacus]